MPVKHHSLDIYGAELYRVRELVPFSIEPHAYLVAWLTRWLIEDLLT